MIATLKRVRWTRLYNLATAVAIGLLAWGYVDLSGRSLEDHGPCVQLDELVQHPFSVGGIICR